MKTLVKIGAGLLLVLGALALTIASLAEPPAHDAIDPAMLITMPDGTRRPLADVLEASRPAPRARDAAPPTDAARPDDDDVITLAPGEVLVLEDIPSRRFVGTDDGGLRLEPNPDDVLGLADLKLDALRAGDGDVAEVLALLRSVPDDHPGYGRAQRSIGWSVMTRLQDRPRAAITHVSRALRADPLDGNAWQDAGRVYARALGLDI